MRMTRQGFLRRCGAMAAIGGAGWPGLERLLEARERNGTPARSRRVTRAEVFPMSLPQTQPLKVALGTPPTADNVLVRLLTSDGVTGLGESSPYSEVMSETQASDLALAKTIAEIVVGRDPFSMGEIVELMDARSPGNPGIKAAFELALWDICGKIAGQPVYRLLGAYRDHFDTDQTVFLADPPTMAARALAIVERGFKAIKVKLGEAPRLDVERVKTIREAVGVQAAIRVDANQGWSPADAVNVLHGIERYDIEFCEQPVPCWDWAGMRQVRANVGMPIMADEAIHSPHDAIVGIREGGMDLINIKLMKTGGILNAVRIAHIAEAADLRCMLGCMTESRLGLTAAAHVVLSQRCCRFADLDAFLELGIDPVVGGMRVERGVVRLDDTPGLGADIDPAFMAKLKPVS